MISWCAEIVSTQQERFLDIKKLFRVVLTKFRDIKKLCSDATKFWRVVVMLCNDIVKLFLRLTKIWWRPAVCCKKEVEFIYMFIKLHIANVLNDMQV